MTPGDGAHRHGEHDDGDHGDHDHDDHSHGHPGHDRSGGGLWARLRHRITPHSHDHTEAIQTAEEAAAHGIKAAWIGLAGMGATAVMQILIVAISGSIALLADTLHNLGHLATTIPLVIAFRMGRRPPTRRYPYGFRRAEDLVGLLIAAVIAASAALIVWESLRAISDPPTLTNLGWVLAAGIVGAVGNEVVAVYRIRAGRRIGSVALIAEGQHARADGLTSVAVVAGVAGVWLGFPEADALVGLGIAAAILWILVGSTRATIRRLMDGVDPGTVEAIACIAEQVPGVERVDRVRARWTGHRLEADLDIAVDGALTVSQSHAVAEAVHHEILHGVRGADHVAVHVNPAHDTGAHDLTGHHASIEARRRYRDVRAGATRPPEG